MTGTSPSPARRRGRPAGGSTAREDILRSAQREFAVHGYEKTSIRAIARGASVDPSLVHHYFRDRGTLFLSAARLAIDPRRLVASIAATGIDGIGRRAIATALAAWESPFGATLERALTSQPRLARGFGAMMGRTIGAAAAEVLGLSEAEAAPRIALVEVVMAGLFYTRIFTRTEPVASMPRAQVVEIFGAVVQQALDGELPAS